MAIEECVLRASLVRESNIFMLLDSMVERIQLPTKICVGRKANHSLLRSEQNECSALYISECVLNGNEEDGAGIAYITLHNNNGKIFCCILSVVVRLLRIRIF